VCNFDTQLLRHSLILVKSAESLGLWREGDSPPGSEYVSHSRGLFPAPVEVNKLDDAAWAKLSSHFKVLGTVVAKGLMDSRILDLPFSQMFMKLMLNQTIPLTIASVRFVDLSLAQSLEHIQKYADEKEAILAAEGISDEDKQAAIGGIEIDGAGIQDLSLDFTLPGYDVELKSGGKEIDLTMDNVEEYIKLVLDWTLVKGVKPMVQKFREGFSAVRSCEPTSYLISDSIFTQVFPVRDLHSFRAEELVLLFGNEEEDWSETTIKDSIKADHGYSPTSAAIFNLVAILTTFDTDMRRKFLSFSTGAARLPLGGFGALNPPLTVVRKAPEDSLSADDILPSASTCANFFKLPDYSTRDIMRQRLELAVREGAGSFHLS
jgi:E3 ubiquitin-protein ligase TRIP12